MALGKYKTANLRKIITDNQPFRGKSNYQNCQGSSFCPNLNCSYRVENKKVNTTRPLQGSKCRWCQAIVEHKDYKARQKIGHGDGFTIVAHCGIHDCDPTRSKPLKSLPKEYHVYFATRFQESPRLTPAVATSNLLSSVVEGDFRLLSPELNKHKVLTLPKFAPM